MQAEAIRGMPRSTLRKLYGLERVCVVRSSVPFGMSKICAALPADRVKADALLRGVPENEDEEEDKEKRGEDEDEEADDEGGRLFGVITNLLGLLSNASLLRDPGSRTGEVGEHGRVLPFDRRPRHLGRTPNHLRGFVP